MVIHLIRNNSRGISLLYVMAALLVGGFIGTGLLKMNHQGKMAAVLYSSSESARTAVNAGFIDATSFLTNKSNQDSVIKIVEAWSNEAEPNDPSKITAYRWISGASGSETLASNCDTLSSALHQYYRVEIIGFDFATLPFKVYLQSYGIGKGKSQARAIGVFELSGLGIGATTVTSWGDENAIYLGDGVSLNTHSKLIVNGNMYIGANSIVTFDNSLSGSIFNNNFIIDTNATVKFNAISATFNGPVYFASKPTTDGGLNLTFNGKSGFNKGMEFTTGTGTFNFNKNTYWNGNATGGSWAGNKLNGNSADTIFHNNLFNLNTNNVDTNNIVGVDRGITGVDIEESLGVKLEQCEIICHPDSISSSLYTYWTTGSTSFNATLANSMYASAIN